MDKETLRQRLMVTFLGELDEHVQALNRDLLALEKDAGEGRGEHLVSLFRTAHSLKGAARAVNIEPIAAVCHRLESLLGSARDGQQPLAGEAMEVLYRTADALKDASERLRAQQDPATVRLQSLLPALDAAAQRLRNASSGPAPGGGAPAYATPSAPPAPSTREGLVRVPADKLDALLAGSGELLIARRRVMAQREDLERLHDEVRQCRAEWRHVDKPIRGLLTSRARLAKRAGLALDSVGERLKNLERQIELLASRVGAEHRALERAAASLDDDIRRVRLFPFSYACEGLERAVRDLAHASAKQVVLVIEGGDIELDRLVLERLKDPLLHLVRNAIDHGIEAPGERRATGKAPDGRVTVAATLRSGAVEIRIADDGRGVDVAAVRAHARGKELRVPEDDEEAARLVFAPGFSTVHLVTELSGRGMGLDVVRHQVESLHGHVDMAFRPGQGTRVVLTVPLTITTIRALLLGVAGQLFAVPVSHVRRLVRASAADLGSVGGREVLLSTDAPIPVVLLADLLGIKSNPAPRHSHHRVPLVVLGAGTRQVALAVDELVAEEEILVKHLGRRLRRVRHLAGATVLPSGRVALILNTADVLSGAVALAPTRTVAGTPARKGDEARRRLLLAEDSVTTRSLEKSILEAAGYEVVAAADGSDAWRLLQDHGADLVVADVEMPRMDGFALCEAIRRSSRFRELPIVLVTALESDADKARGLAAGADAYLPKTAFDQRQLLETIAQLL